MATKETYGSADTGGTLDVIARGTTVTVGFDSSIVLVGGYDATDGDAEINNGTISSDEVVEVTDASDAADKFGEDSELHLAAKAAYANGVNTVYGVAVPETTGATDSISSGQSTTLTDQPFDPNVNTEHSITVTDTDTSSDLTTNIVYDDSPSTPADSDTANVNPLNKKVEIDASGNYDITYDHGDYDTAITTAVDADSRFTVVLNESASPKSKVKTELDDHASDFDFERGFTGAKPDIDGGSTGSYTPDEEDQRVVEFAPARWDDDDGNEIRAVAAFAAKAAAQPLGSSIIYDEIDGLDTPTYQAYTPSQASSFNQVSSATENTEIIQAITTSATSEFADIFRVEIIDTVAEALQEIAKDYAGGPNTQDDRNNLASDLRITLKDFASRRPPLLDAGDGSTPYSVKTSLGNSDDVTDVQIGVEVLNVMKEVNIDLSVGDIVTFEGASA